MLVDINEKLVGNIYAIFCEEAKKVYIGKTGRNVKTRFDEHLLQVDRNEHGVEMQEDFKLYGKDGFRKIFILKSKDYDLCENILIELFSRLGKSYNRNRGLNMSNIIFGNIVVSESLFYEVENILINLCKVTNNDYKKTLETLFDIKQDVNLYRNFIENRAVRPNIIRTRSAFNIYNYEYKMYYLATAKYSLQSKKTVIKELGVVRQSEEKLGKDLYDFSLQEAEALVMSLEMKTLRSVQNYIIMFKKYLEFAIALGVSVNTINYYVHLGKKENATKFLDDEVYRVLTKEKVIEITDELENSQDAVILGLIFEGLSNKNEFEELINLKKDALIRKEDGSFDVILTDRCISLSSETTNLVEEALNQLYYTSSSGKGSREYKLTQGENVLRGLRGKEKVTSQLINQRLMRIKELTKVDYLNATSLVYSGQLHLAEELIIKKRKTLEEAVPYILNRFGSPDNEASRFYFKKRIRNHFEKNGYIV